MWRAGGRGENALKSTIRTPGAGSPTCPSDRSAGEPPERVGYSEDGTVSFSSLWRYKAALGYANAQRRTRAPMGTEAVREALRHVDEGETEHSIVVRPDARRGHTSFDLAVASPSLEGALWDAPYRVWATFAFEECFLQ